MTNNQTIDGVSRELLSKLLAWLARANEKNEDGDIAEFVELRALLDAPAVERQEPLGWAYCPECGSEEIHHEEGAHKQCAECHQEWFSDLDYTDVVRKHLGGKFTDLQSTIAQLQARVAELESRRGEPVMKLEAERLWDGDGEYAVSFVKAGWLDECRRTGGKFLLYTAPPAPVAVMLPDERAAFEDYYADYVGIDVASVRSWRKGEGYSNSYERCQISWEVWKARACLDATAALNDKPTNEVTE